MTSNCANHQGQTQNYQGQEIVHGRNDVTKINAGQATGRPGGPFSARRELYPACLARRAFRSIEAQYLDSMD